MYTTCACEKLRSKKGEGEPGNKREDFLFSLCPSLPYPAVRRRRRHGYHHRARYGLGGGGVSSLHPRRGLVHFSSVVELRAAATEMNDYRMITTVSRTTGFGQTQSIHYLKYALKPIITYVCTYCSTISYNCVF